jgi:hypothetical protein
MEKISKNFNGLRHTAVQTATQLTLCKGKANYAVWIQIYADFFGILSFPA